MESPKMCGETLGSSISPSSIFAAHISRSASAEVLVVVVIPMLSLCQSQAHSPSGVLSRHSNGSRLFRAPSRLPLAVSVDSSAEMILRRYKHPLDQQQVPRTLQLVPDLHLLQS
jgi:hypothetical protein